MLHLAAGPARIETSVAGPEPDHFSRMGKVITRMAYLLERQGLMRFPFFIIQEELLIGSSIALQALCKRGVPLSVGHPFDGKPNSPGWSHQDCKLPGARQTRIE